MLKYLLITLAFVSFALGDATVWDYDLTYLPANWYASSAWYFFSSGASLEIVADNYTRIDSIITVSVTIPDNCDSVILHCVQDLSVGVVSMGGPAGAFANVSYKFDSNQWESLFNQTSWNLPAEDFLHLLIPPESGNVLSFRFKAYASAYSSPYSISVAYVTWRLSNLTLTFYGDDLSLENTTWGNIKSTLIY